VNLVVNGRLLACSDRDAWPQRPDNHSPAMLYLEDSTHFVLTGSGVLDGQGYGWWVGAVCRIVYVCMCVYVCVGVSVSQCVLVGQSITDVYVTV
jgi:hypothetical protein